MSVQLSENITMWTRRDWGAVHPSSVLKVQPTPKEAFLHHTVNSLAAHVDTLAEQKMAVRAIQRGHMRENGWSDIGYHYLVFQPYGSLDYARVFQGRQHQYVPAAQANHNTGTIAIAVYGDFRTDGVKPNTRHAIATLIRTRHAQVALLGGHRDVFPTSCPGPKLYAAIPRIADNINAATFALASMMARTEMSTHFEGGPCELCAVGGNDTEFDHGYPG